MQYKNWDKYGKWINTSESGAISLKEGAPDGAKKLYEAMVHNRAVLKTVEVVAAVIIQESKVFATQRGYGEFKDGWEFPGGKIEAGETPEEALIREIQEELDTTVEVQCGIGTVEYDYPSFHLTMHCYICAVVSGNLELKEHEAAKWLSLEELDDVDWLPADVVAVEYLRNFLE